MDVLFQYGQNGHCTLSGGSVHPKVVERNDCFKATCVSVMLAPAVKCCTSSTQDVKRLYHRHKTEKGGGGLTLASTCMRSTICFKRPGVFLELRISNLQSKI
ncbi:hypothetical protein Y1Q_0007616 [Alligator mississippiensis]|uniref:Uncharacterized protein n=1 Tax=Alligator mississippiensis TaxID=8496 RepID=A0A151NC25_ALLMI|nr:hypothetical protein Y1Q_0007616 [Alligator mississippiensis]